MFQTRTGFPGHSDLSKSIGTSPHEKFQTRTGFPGHSDADETKKLLNFLGVSNPNGLPRPFRRLIVFIVSVFVGGFKPERASQAIPTSSVILWSFTGGMFQTRTG